jgi:hypothetical protein
MITRTRVFGSRYDVILASCLFTATAALSAGLAGSVLGSIGGLLESPARIGLAAAALIALGAATFRRREPWQLNRETNPDWLLLADWRTAVYNASSLGLGFTTRIGFWAFFLVPIGAFLSGSAVLGALVYSSYALTRSLASLALARVPLRSEDAAFRIKGSTSDVRVIADVFFLVAIGYLLAGRLTG